MLPFPRNALRRVAAIIGVALAVAAGVWAWREWRRGTAVEALLKQARLAQASRDFARCEQLASSALRRAPHRAEAAFLASESASSQRNWTAAVRYLQQADARDRRTQCELLWRTADLQHQQLHRLADAERSYRAVLALDADHRLANSGLVHLLSLCGRTREAAPHVLRLIRQGAEFDLLLLLARSDAAVDDLATLQLARTADPADVNPLLGLAWHALRSERHEEADRLLHAALQLEPDSVPALILQGQLWLADNRTAEFGAWTRRLPPSADGVGEVWLLRGQMAEELGDSPGAIRCYWETLRRLPESKAATYRLAHLLAASDSAQVEPFRERLRLLRELEETQSRVLFAADRGRPELLLPLARAYANAGRLWEALGWCQFAGEIGADTDELRALAGQLRDRLEGEPLQLVADAANPALAVDLSRYPLPQFAPRSLTEASSIPATERAPAFRDDAFAVGLQFQYFNGVSGPPTHRMFEFTGGGLAALDFDLDGFTDVACTQGCRWPPGSADDSAGDRLFRNRLGTRFEDVTDAAGIHEAGFGQGATIGDFNADGFPDLYVANIGSNALWVNLGDGTFRDVTGESGLSGGEWTTSTVMADLTGDGLPDIYDVNYVTAPDLFDRVCRAADGSPKLCMPFDFHGESDRLWKNLGDGRFADATLELLGETPLGMGLGVAAWDADGAGRLSLFVANDTTPSFFFRPDTGDNGTVRLRESGVEAGLAYNGAGKATGCMGVALGDADRDGRLDLHITNFYAEPNTLFLNPSPGLFTDSTRRSGLESPSMNMLGFGTQFLDADLDGHLDLFVANGHIDDLTRFGRPYRMPPQLFRWDGRQQFHEWPPQQAGPYFERGWLGRAVARLDWNRDGRDDLLVGHLDDPLALLTNVTEAPGASLSLRLIGVSSNRDAIGTVVRAQTGALTQTCQLTAGDGYHASNERKLVIGVGRATQVDELAVRWPSGLEQRFVDLSAPGEFVLREGWTPLPLTRGAR